MDLLNRDQLDRSSVVANCQMNRERPLAGRGSYASELGFDPLDELTKLAASGTAVAWLDLCCGSGAALVEAATAVHAANLQDRIRIVGVDLIPRPAIAELRCLQFVEASLSTWTTSARFDVITCVHGLHYVGDKLDLIARAAAWLTPSGRFAANLDLANIAVQDCPSSSRTVARELRAQGFLYDTRKKLLSRAGHQELSFPFRYLGADDRAGPNYTRQPAVTSYYQSEEPPTDKPTTKQPLSERHARLTHRGFGGGQPYCQ
jgi:SAM-dependent methyltransferase